MEIGKDIRVPVSSQHHLVGSVYEFQGPLEELARLLIHGFTPTALSQCAWLVGAFSLLLPNGLQDNAFILAIRKKATTVGDSDVVTRDVGVLVARPIVGIDQQDLPGLRPTSCGSTYVAIKPSKEFLHCGKEIVSGFLAEQDAMCLDKGGVNRNQSRVLVKAI